MAEEPLSPDARTRAADLFEAHAGPMTRRLAARFPGTDPQTISDAVVRAILWVSSHYERYDPRRASLAAFLTVVARRFIMKLLRAEERRRCREQEKALDPVTASDSAGQSLLDGLVNREQVEQVRASLHLNPEEERILDLWLLGEKDQGVYAAALGLAGQPGQEQEQAVRRVLDRLRQRLHRIRVRLRQEGLDE